MNKFIPSIMLASMAAVPAQALQDKNFDFHVDRFGDIEVLRYEVPEYQSLSLEQKKMLLSFRGRPDGT